MKKLLLLFAVMLSTVGAWAQVELLKSTNVENPEYQYIMMNGSGAWMKSTTSNGSASEVGRFAFFPYGENENDVLIYSIDEGKWVSYTKADSYSNKKDFAQLVEVPVLEDANATVNPWRYTSMTIKNGGFGFQFAPHNNSGVASKYMNWFQGTSNNTTIGLWQDNASADNGSGWIIAQVPVEGIEYVLQDFTSGIFVNLYDLGEEANDHSYNLLATMSTSPKSLYITPNSDDFKKWSIHTEEEGGNYLNQYTGREWNSKVNNDETAVNFRWTIEPVNIDNKVIAFTLCGNSNRYLGGTPSSGNGEPLYVDGKDDNKYLKFVVKENTPVICVADRITNNKLIEGRQVLIKGVGGRKGWAYKGTNAKGATYMNLWDTGSSPLGFSEEFVFTVVESGAEGNFKLQAFDGTYFKGGNEFTTELADATNLALKAKPNADPGVWNIAYNGTYLNMNASQDDYVSVSPITSNYVTTGWSDENDVNGKWELYYINDVEQSDITLTLSDVLGNEYSIDYRATVSVFPEINGIPYNYISNVNWESQNSVSATITFPFPVSKEGGLTNATMISNFDADKKWIAKNVNGVYNIKCYDITTTPTIEEFSAGVWAIYPMFASNAFTFKIKNLATGKYVTLNKTNTSFDTEGTVTLTETATPLDVIEWLGKPCFKKAGATLYLTVNSPGDTDVYLSTWTGGNNGHEGNKYFFQTPSFQTSITDAKAATLYTPVAVTIPEDVTAKYVKAEGENMGSTGKLVYTKLENIIPANSAVVLTGEAGDYTFTATTEAGEEVADNVLLGYATQTAATDNTGIYALANKTNGVAFYPFAGSTYKAGKAYLNIAGLRTTSEVRLFNIFDEGEETGIESIETENAKAEIYDLAGRRVQKAQKGLYIVNGVKVIK